MKMILKSTNTNKIPHKKGCLLGYIQVHANPPLITIIKVILKKTREIFHKIKFGRNPMSDTSNMYEFKMALEKKWQTGRVPSITAEISYDV